MKTYLRQAKARWTVQSPEIRYLEDMQNGNGEKDLRLEWGKSQEDSGDNAVIKICTPSCDSTPDGS